MTNLNTGKCALCLEVKTLKDSHLIPRSLYKLLRKMDGTSDEIISINDGKSMYNDRQFSEYLLCGECEDIFNKKGESTVIKQCYRGVDQFILRDTFRESKLSSDLSKKYLYFAASVFWRASVFKNIQFKHVTLGPYEGHFRKYLFEGHEFPVKARIQVKIDASKDVPAAMEFPNCGRLDGFHLHYFQIPGMKFSLLLGGKLPNLNWKGPINFIEGKVSTESFFKAGLSSIPKGKLSREF